MKKLLLFAVAIIMGCTVGPRARNYQTVVEEPVESPFFYVPPLNLADYKDRTWILLAESTNKNWFYDPYTLSEDEDGVITFDAFNLPREKNTLAQFNATMVGPYRQKIDCFGNHQWSETLYTKNLPAKAAVLGDTKPINGSGWIKIRPKTAMAFIRTRVCGRKFVDDQNVNYFLYQDGLMPIVKAAKVAMDPKDPSDKNELGNVELAIKQIPQEQVIEAAPTKTPIFYDVVNNQVSIIDSKTNIREMKITSYALDKDLSKKQDYVFIADCQNVSYSFSEQKSRSSPKQALGEKDSFSAVAFNRACGDHGAYVKLVNQGR